MEAQTSTNVLDVGWIHRRDLINLMSALPPPLGFKTDASPGSRNAQVSAYSTPEQKQKEVEKVRCKLPHLAVSVSLIFAGLQVLASLPNRGGRIQCNETLVALSLRVLDPLRTGNPYKVPDHVRRKLKTEGLIKVNSSRKPEEIQSREIREAFDNLDEDGSGALDHAEVAKALKVLGLNEDPRVALDAMDADNNGLVEYNEFLTWFCQKFGRKDRAGRVRLGSMGVESSPAAGMNSPQVWHPANADIIAEEAEERRP